jgi:hypothetical protein
MEEVINTITDGLFSVFVALGMKKIFKMEKVNEILDDF